jgi:hypothetical protein
MTTQAGALMVIISPSARTLFRYGSTRSFGPTAVPTLL